MSPICSETLWAPPRGAAEELADPDGGMGLGVAPPGAAAEADDSDASSVSAGSDASSEELADGPGLVRWAIPRRSSTTHLLRGDDEHSLIPVCRHAAFVGAEAQYGV
jgi:hypothetical protein